MKFPLLFVLFISFYNASLGQIDPVSDLESYIENTLPEKIYLHTDKDVYAVGENLWVAIYLVNGISHSPGTFSELVYVELRDSKDKIIYERKVYTPEGHGKSDFKIGGNLLPGNYSLVAYTNHQLNSSKSFIFQKKIKLIAGLDQDLQEPIVTVENTKKVVSKNNIPEVQFFPEGGDCVEGVPCRVSFTVSNALGEIEGVIKDDLGTIIGKVTRSDRGIGKFVYIPAPDKEYILESTTERQYNLPKALTTGYHLSVRKQKDKLRITITSSPNETVDGARIILHVRGDVLIDQTISSKERSALVYAPYFELPLGVVSVLVLDSKSEPIAERLFFVAPEADGTNINIELDRTTVGFRTPIKMSMTAPLNNENLDSLNVSRMSVSIMPESFANSVRKEDLRTWILLNSDLEEHININPDLLFGSEAKTSLKRVDDILLTRAWRRFSWKSDEYFSDYEQSYPLELGIYVQGKMTKSGSPKRPQAGKVFLTNIDAGFMEEVVTDDQGRFVFGPYLAYDTTAAIIQGRYSKSKDLNDITIEDKPFVDLLFQKRRTPEFEYIPKEDYPIESSINLAAYKEFSDKFLSVSQSYDSLTITLDEVLFKSTYKSKIESERDSRAESIGVKDVNSRLIIDSLAVNPIGQSIFDVLRNFPGLFVRGVPGQEEVLIRGTNSILAGSIGPLFIVDGTPIDITFLRTYPVENIDFIDVVRGIRAVNLFGIDATNGAVIIYTRNGSGAIAAKKDAPGMKNIEIRGFYKGREFATFDPEEIGNQNRPDIRTTLFWDPMILSDTSGKATQSFTTSDQNGKYIIIAQGIRSDGVPLFGKTIFQVDSSSN